MGKVTAWVNKQIADIKGQPLGFYDDVVNCVEFDNERFVYFIRDGADGLIQIGFTERLRHRLSDLHGSSARPLILLGVVRGGEPLERELHRRFACDRAHREWFKATTRVIAGIKALLDSPCAFETTPQWLSEYIKIAPRKENRYR